MDTLYQKLNDAGIIPVIAIDDATAALALADALIEGGLPLAEITFRTAAAADVIRILADERPEMLVGAGTVLTLENLQLAKRSGAAFAVAPGLNPRIVAKAQELDLPMIPGVVTPSEIEQGLELGCRCLKFFPAEASGGLKMVQALAAPYKHMGVRFMPTGGINPGNLPEYVKCDAVLTVGGTWLATKDDITQGRWADVRERCRTALEVVKAARVKQVAR
jgi:2-dehydro-3-deoxyphosphogluconate aldolase/(4S)-4-hydroxy-2-oxoglutarate aldolase